MPGLNTDIKATSIVQPQSSCPYRNARQKIFGLGYNLIVFVYEKKDYIDNDQRLCKINFKYITFIEKHRTADYTTTQMLINMKNTGANKEDIVSYLNDRGIPGDEIEHNMIAEEILKKPFEQGYLTVSNALQWRLQYKRVIELNNQIEGVYNYVR
ncbi:restriction endonuclease [Leptotrichia trevisanii]|uniref:restriction endonuclease n=1 Tax=Leptotrichia trevisanii TaxID=109328 RepID=UPI0026EF159E|nr:restriction endonuclease [Leptotrichia trevisanii]